VLKEIQNKSSKILVVGLGYRTGLSTANYLISKGYSVDVSDSKSADELISVSSQLKSGIRLFAGNQNMSLLDNGYDLIVLSPGVPAYIPLIKAAYEKKIKVIAEVELAYHFTRGSWVAITGTDGKSTTTAFTNHLMKSLGLNSREGGNIGIPLISLADDSSDDTVTVAELSSYQLETVDSFKADAALITNLTPDHLDRYPSVDAYFDTKMNIVNNQTSSDYFVYNADDENILKRLGHVKSKKYSFSLKDKTASAYYDGTHILLNVNGRYEKVVVTEKLSVLGVHNIQNCMSAILLTKAVFEKMNMSLPHNHLERFCISFKGLHHRMEKLGICKGRLFINDSKATTVGAVEMAVKSVNSNSVFIMGGRGKGDNYSRLAEIMKDKVKGVVLIGETADEFYGIFNGFNRIKAASLSDATEIALQMTTDGDNIILSPACASFDMFQSYEHRGDEFRKIYERLSSGHE